MSPCEGSRPMTSCRLTSGRPMDVASTPDIALDGGGEHGGTAAEVKFVGMGGWADNKEEAIDLEGVASACRHLLACAPPGCRGGGGEGRGRSSVLLFVTRVRIHRHTRGCSDVASLGRVLMPSGTAGRNGDCSFGSLCPFVKVGSLTRRLALRDGATMTTTMVTAGRVTTTTWRRATTARTVPARLGRSALASRSGC